MKKVPFELETVTPVFCSGANPKKPEIRPASFKGMMRYWYRATFAENNIRRLHNIESKIYGSTKRASSFIIRIKDVNEVNKNKTEECPVPHKGKFEILAIKRDITFDIEIILKNKKYQKLIRTFLELALLLGGIAKRSRRGFGSIAMRGTTFNNTDNFLGEVKDKLEKIKERNYKINGNKLIIEDDLEYKYPVIKELIVGKSGSREEILKRIGQATHDCRDWGLGNGNPRMASPIYVTVNKIGDKFYPVITRLEAIYPSNFRVNNEEIEEFIERIENPSIND